MKAKNIDTLIDAPCCRSIPYRLLGSGRNPGPSSSHGRGGDGSLKRYCGLEQPEALKKTIMTLLSSWQQSVFSLRQIIGFSLILTMKKMRRKTS